MRMGRLIDADKINYHEHTECMGHGDFETVRTVTDKEIAEIPTVDAVEVVRCKDCKHKGWAQEPCHGKSVDYCRIWECCLGNINTTFCSYGERKDGDGNGGF